MSLQFLSKSHRCWNRYHVFIMRHCLINSQQTPLPPLSPSPSVSQSSVVEFTSAWPYCVNTAIRRSAAEFSSLHLLCSFFEVCFGNYCLSQPLRNVLRCGNVLVRKEEPCSWKHVSTQCVLTDMLWLACSSPKHSWAWGQLRLTEYRLASVLQSVWSRVWKSGPEMSWTGHRTQDASAQRPAVGWLKAKWSRTVMKKSVLALQKLVLDEMRPKINIIISRLHCDSSLPASGSVLCVNDVVFYLGHVVSVLVVGT